MNSCITQRFGLITSVVMALSVASCSVEPTADEKQPSATTAALPEVAKMDIHASDGELGKAVFGKWCAICHSAGPVYPGTIALTERYKGTDISGVLTERKDLDPDYVKHVIRNGIFNMPNFRKTEISDAELDALAEFLASPNKR